MNKNLILLKEFRPALRFLLIFVSIYLVGNILYGIWIESWRPVADPITVSATRQTVYLLRAFSEPVSCERSLAEPIVNMLRSNQMLLRVFEGCNGINVVIVFIAFLFAFRGTWKRMLIFGAGGIVVIHLANLLRLGLLYYTAAYRPLYFYYFHKYLFTACIYLVVFALWYIWMGWTGINKHEIAPAEKQVE